MIWRWMIVCALAWTAVLPIAPSASADHSLSVFASAHYHIHTDLSRRQTVPFGRHMDLLFDQYERRFRRLRIAGAVDPDSGNPLYLLSTEERYHRFMQQVGVAAQNSGGMFFVTRDHHGVATWADGRNRATTRRTLHCLSVASSWAWPTPTASRWCARRYKTAPRCRWPAC